MYAAVAPSSSVGRAHIDRMSSSERSVSSMTVGNKSAASLSRSLSRTSSLETPLGPVRTSSITMEPIHSGSSLESFKREISAFKINAMPALAEDDTINDEDEGDRSHRSKTRDRSKIKRSKRIYEPEFTEIDIESENEMQPAAALVNKANNTKTSKLDKCFKFVCRIIPCTKSSKSNRDPALLEIDSSPRDA